MYKNIEMSATIRIPINTNDEILTKITVNEYVDVKLIDKILKSNILKKLNWEENDVTTMEISLKLLRKQVNKDGFSPITFESRPYGRVYPKKNKITLGTLYRRVRHTLCKKYYVDVDIVNCQVTLLNSILLCNGYTQFSKLNTYVENRDEVLNIIMTSYNCNREVAKNLIISLINGGSFATWKAKNNLNNSSLKYIDELATELIEIKNIIERNNSDAIKIIKDYKLKKGKEYKGDYTFMSYFLDRTI